MHQRSQSLYPVFLSLCAAFLLIFGSSNASTINSIDFKRAPAKNSVSIKVDGPASYAEHYLPESDTKPPRFYVDFEPSQLPQTFVCPGAPKGFPIEQIRCGQNSPSKVRIVFELAKGVEKEDLKLAFKQSTLSIAFSKNDLEVTSEPKGQPSPANNADEEESSPLDLPIDLNERAPSRDLPAKNQKKPGKEKVRLSPRAKPKNKRHRIIIDPGHGGHQPGSIGPYFGTKEKHIALQISRRLESILKKDRKYEVYMTREQDQTLGLHERTEFANKLEGDLLVSMHCNASTNRKASGVSTYFLHNADDEESLRVAMRENGRLAAPKLKKSTGSSDYYFEVMKASMMKNFHTVQSTDLARQVQSYLMKELKPKYPKIKDRGVRSAGLYVLTGANMPSILVETSFITNRTEEKLLRKPSYQYSIALSVYRGIQNYFKMAEKNAHLTVYRQ